MKHYFIDAIYYREAFHYNKKLKLVTFVMFLKLFFFLNQTNELFLNPPFVYVLSLKIDSFR